MTNLSQTEQALSKGAEKVETARIEVKQKCNTVSDKVNEMMAGWGGQGASSFGNLMVAWQEKQEKILQALDGLAASMRETEKDNVATDQSQSDAHLNLQNRLG
ncbi:MAG: hypothetical protein JWN68_3369 [Nocardioides sp.]|jgi:WXG100 family type VII secretion target|uniref:WXG100 family type VII secretion target n=1 Tax=Nocardioides sp. TaxID=35761 RepID=UPI00260F5610|nr:WXG100 family type VII secretion target [Nocardioides sp.]MCW2835416.1 hypothetical protein [Nocardioides sp.]